MGSSVIGISLETVILGAGIGATGSHNRANCFSAYSWNLFVKDGVVCL